MFKELAKLSICSNSAQTIRTLKQNKSFNFRVNEEYIFEVDKRRYKHR